MFKEVISQNTSSQLSLINGKIMDNGNIAIENPFGIENIPPGAILQDIVPVNPRSRPVVLADRNSDNTFPF
jgi:hypothetical protein